MKRKLSYKSIQPLIIISIITIVIFYVIKLPFFKQFESYNSSIQKFVLSIFFISIIFMIRKILEQLIHRKENQDEGIKYNLIQILKISTLIFAFIIIVSFLFQNLYAAAVSFGLISLIIGFALQSPITSFIAWIYIVIKHPYRVGDRIQIDGYKGDVIQIGYLETTIEEISGNYVGNDKKSGRVVIFPNSLILKTHVLNYNGPYDTYIWNETAIQISFTSDLKTVESILQELTDQDFEQYYKRKIYKKFKSDVYFRVNTYAWLEVVISYPVKYDDTTGRRNRILKAVLPALNAEKIGFPEGTNR